MLAPQAHADWVLVKLQGKFVETSQNKQDGGTLAGTPQTYNKGTTSGWGGAMQLDGYTFAQLPAPPQNSYGGQPTPYTGGTAITAVDGSNFKATLEWQGGGTPTDDCSLIIASSGEVFATGYRGNEPHGPLSADSGAKTGNGSYLAKDNQELTTEPAPTGNDYAAYMAYSAWMNKYPDGNSQKRLGVAGETHIPVSTRSKVLNAEGRWVVEKSISMVLKGSASVTTKGFDSTAKATTRLSFKVDPSSRGLSISRVGATGPIKIKGQPGVTIDEDKDEWIDEDGTGHGHTIYSYQGWGIGGITEGSESSSYGRIPNLQGFSATLKGWNNPTFQWTPPANTDTLTNHAQEMPDGTLNESSEGYPYWKGSPTGHQQKSITNTITDSGGATISAKYEITLHDPVEDIAATTTLVQLNARPVQAAITKTSAGQKVTVTASNSVAYSLKVGFSGELGKKIADLLPIVPKVSVDFTATGTTTTGYSVGVDDLGVNQQTWLEVVDQYTRYAGTCNQWGQSGFAGIGSFSVDVPDATQPYSFRVRYPYINVGQSGGTGGGS